MFGSKNNTSTEELAEALVAIAALTERVEALEKANAELAGRVAALEQDREERADRQGRQDLPEDSHESSLMPLDGVAPSTSVENQSEASGVSVLYLEVPNTDGTFTGASPQETIGKSIYRLTTADGHEGTFAILTSPDAIATAMISITQFIKPVCRVEGNTHRMPEAVETVEEGIAEMRDGVWTVTRKATVRFK